MDFTNPIYQNLLRFANKHKLVLEDHGEVGFGRPCVGFMHGDCYVAFNPSSHPDFELIPELYDKRLRPPEGVRAYHKHDCLAVLVENNETSFDEGLRQLNEWVNHLEAQGEIEVVTYATGATGIQAIFSGTRAKAIRFITPPATEPGEERSE